MNLTKTVRKLPINEEGQRAGYYVHDDLSNINIMYDEPTVRTSKALIDCGMCH
jgi:serine/threonine-protein kinase RIO1